MNETIEKKLLEVAENVPKVYESGVREGKAAERDKLWDRLQSNGKPTRYYWRFAYSNWNDDIYNPKYDIVGVNANNALGNTFYTSDITDTKVAIDATRVPTGLDATFYWARNMQRIRKLIITETTTFKIAFTDCGALISIDEIEGAIGNNLSLAWSTLLNKDSITNLINALSTNTTGLTITLSLTAVNSAFQTAEELADGSTSEEWLALIAEKENWTITLEDK